MEGGYLMTTTFFVLVNVEKGEEKQVAKAILDLSLVNRVIKVQPSYQLIVEVSDKSEAVRKTITGSLRKITGIRSTLALPVQSSWGVI